MKYVLCFILVILRCDLPVIKPESQETVLFSVSIRKLLSNKWHLKKPKFFKPIYSLYLLEVIVFHCLRPTGVHITISRNQKLPHIPGMTSTTSSDQEVFFNPQPSTSTSAQEMPNVYMPYIEGPTMDCMIKDGLYNRFLKWWLRCKNILECELVRLTVSRKCKKVLAWSGDFGLGQYISWNLSSESNMTLEVI